MRTSRITEKAVVARLRRALLPKYKYLRLADRRRQERWGQGHYYLLNAKGVVVDKDVDIERVARERRAGAVGNAK